MYRVHVIKKPENLVVFESRKIIPGIVVTYTNDVSNPNQYQLIWNPYDNRIVSMSHKHDASQRAETRSLHKNWEGVETTPIPGNADDRMYLCFDFDTKTKIPKRRKILFVTGLLNSVVGVHLLGSPAAQADMDRWTPEFGPDECTPTEYIMEHDIDVVLELDAFTRIRFSRNRNMASFEYKGELVFKRDLTNTKNYVTSEDVMTRACEHAAFTYLDLFKAVLLKMKLEACRTSSKKKPAPKSEGQA